MYPGKNTNNDMISDEENVYLDVELDNDFSHQINTNTSFLSHLTKEHLLL